MDNRQGPGARAGSLGGKGFYIVLFLCAAVIGISAWIAITDAGTNVEDLETMENAVDVSGVYVTMLPAGTANGTEDAVDAMSDDAVPAEGETVTAGEDDPALQTAEQTEPVTQAVFADGTVSYVWPVQGTIYRPYSIQTLMYDSTMADWRTHDGIDIGCGLGTPVLAVAGGLVVDVRHDDLLGTVVELDHANGMHSVYANLAGQPPVAPGATVTMGQVIGSVGNTALGEVNQVSHLHFAMTEDGLSADPTLYLPSDWTQ